MTLNELIKERDTVTDWLNAFQGIISEHLLSDEQRERFDDLKWGFLAEFDAEICYTENMLERVEDIEKHRAFFEEQRTIKVYQGILVHNSLFQMLTGGTLQ